MPSLSPEAIPGSLNDEFVRLTSSTSRVESGRLRQQYHTLELGLTRRKLNKLGAGLRIELDVVDRYISDVWDKFLQPEPETEKPRQDFSFPNLVALAAFVAEAAAFKIMSDRRSRHKEARTHVPLPDDELHFEQAREEDPSSQPLDHQLAEHRDHDRDDAVKAALELVIKELERVADRAAILKVAETIVAEICKGNLGLLGVQLDGVASLPPRNIAPIIGATPNQVSKATGLLKKAAANLGYNTLYRLLAALDDDQSRGYS